MYYWEKLKSLKTTYDGKPAFMGPKSNYTGKGEDGVLQANRPAAIDMSSNSPVVLHEGETVKDTPMGRKVTPAKLVPLNSNDEQMQAAQLEKEMGLPGMQIGGIIPNNEQFGMATSNQAAPQFGLNPPVPQQSRGQSPAPALNPPAPAPNDPATANAVAGGGVNTLATQRDGNTQTSQPVNPLAGKPIGMDTLQGIATGETDLYKGIYDKINKEQQGRLGSAQAAEKAASAQSNAQAGISGARVNVLGAAQDRTQSLERGAVAQELNKQQMNTQAQAQEGAIQDVIQGKKEAIADLIKLGGADNLAQAEEYAMDVYGTDVYGLGNIANDQKMTAIAKYTAIPGMTIEGAMELMKQNGDLEMFGEDVSEEDVRSIASSLLLGSDPIYQAQSHYGDLLSQGVIDQDEYNDVVDFVKWGQTNPDGYEIKDSFRVTDANGNELGNFQTSEEADLFMQQNPGEYSTEQVTNGYIGVKGEYDEYFGDYLQGDVFTGIDGGIYTVVDGQKVAARPTPENAFSMQNNAILNYLTANGMDNDMAKSIKQQQLNDALTNPNNVPLDMLPSSELYTNLINKSNNISVAAGGSRDDVSEQGGAHDSEKILSAFHSLPNDTWVQMGGRLYLYKGVTRKIEDGQDDTNQYQLIDPVTNEQIYYGTTTNGKLEKSTKAGQNYHGGAAEDIAKGFFTGGIASIGDVGQG
jgi:hypothetical protein